jgi:hypothetical protein
MQFVSRKTHVVEVPSIPDADLYVAADRYERGLSHRSGPPFALWQEVTGAVENVSRLSSSSHPGGC